MKSKIGLAVLSLILLNCCDRPSSVGESNAAFEADIQPTPQATKPPIPDQISAMTASELCDRLISIDILPDSRDPTITDPIYESLIAKRDEAIPCLIEKITDRTPVPDPRYSVPSWRYFAVGDTAVFTLLAILSRNDDQAWERLMIESLPPKSAKEWETNGVYAYFNYVSEPRNRADLQLYWKERLKVNQKEE